MKLSEYLIEKKILPDKFAVDCGISVASMYRYLRGSSMHFNTAIKIEKFTNGEVTIKEIYDAGKSRKRRK